MSQERLSAALDVERAAGWAETMTMFESRRPGDYENARRRLERRHGISLWSLLYRKPKDISRRAYRRLREAYLDHCEAVVRRVEADMAGERARGAADDHFEELVARAGELLAEIEAARGGSTEDVRRDDRALVKPPTCRENSTGVRREKWRKSLT